jgi:hypothetical protein
MMLSNVRVKGAVIGVEGMEMVAITGLPVGAV